MAAGPWCGAGRKLGWVPTPAQMHWRGNPTKLAVDKSTVPIGMNTLSKDTIAEWDSMGHLSLVTSLEERFHISIAIADAMDMTSVKKVKDVLKSYGVAF